MSEVSDKASLLSCLLVAEAFVAITEKIEDREYRLKCPALYTPIPQVT